MANSKLLAWSAVSVFGLLALTHVAGFVRSRGSSSLQEVYSLLTDCRDNARPDTRGLRCDPTVLLVWSPQMPLSRKAKQEVLEVGRDLGYRVLLLRGSSLTKHEAHKPIREFQRSLIAAGATTHYPAVLLMDRARPVGPAVTGYRQALAYRQSLLARVRSIQHIRGNAAHPGSPTHARHDLSVIPRADTEIVWTLKLEEHPGAFFRHLPNTDVISYDARSKVYLYDMANDLRVQGPGWIDLVPSPDGRFYVTPARARLGLEFYSTAAVLRLFGDADVSVPSPILIDSTMPDQYPSVGLLSRDEENNASQYRVLTSWTDRVRYRDYRVQPAADGSTLNVSPLGSTVVPCPDHTLSLPMLAPNGRLMAAREDSTGLTVIFSIGRGECGEIARLRYPASKVAWDYAAQQLAFSTPQSSKGTSVTLLYDLLTDEYLALPGTVSTGLTIPTFVGRDSIMVYINSDDRAHAAFRILCCVGTGSS